MIYNLALGRQAPEWPELYFDSMCNSKKKLNVS